MVRLCLQDTYAILTGHRLFEPVLEECSLWICLKLNLNFCSLGDLYCIWSHIFYSWGSKIQKFLEKTKNYIEKSPILKFDQLFHIEFNFSMIKYQTIFIRCDWKLLLDIFEKVRPYDFKNNVGKNNFCLWLSLWWSSKLTVKLLKYNSVKNVMELHF